MVHDSKLNPLYGRYCTIKSRCYNPNVPSYKSYGGRGIKMCSAWVYDYDAFEEWALNSGYSEDLTIERIDNDGDYSPGNCRWATRFEQAQNQSFTKFVEYDGVDCSVSEACRRAGFDKTVFYDYLKESGCSHQEVFDFMLVKKALNVRLLRQKTKNTL